MTNTASDWDQAYRPSYAKIRHTVVRHIQVHLQYSLLSQTRDQLLPIEMLKSWSYLLYSTRVTERGMELGCADIAIQRGLQKAIVTYVCCSGGQSSSQLLYLYFVIHEQFLFIAVHSSHSFSPLWQCGFDSIRGLQFYYIHTVTNYTQSPSREKRFPW